MNFLTQMDALSKALIGVLTLAGLAFTFARWMRPKLKQAASDIRAGRDALVGRDAIRDSITGKELFPALPGIGVRMATTEASLSQLTTAVAKLVDNDARLTDVEHRTKALEDAMVERVVTRAESAAAWRAVEAVAHSAPPDESE